MTFDVKQRISGRGSTACCFFAAGG